MVRVIQKPISIDFEPASNGLLTAPFVLSDAGRDRVSALQPAPGAGGQGHTEAERDERLLGSPPEDHQVTQQLETAQAPTASSLGPFPSLMGKQGFPQG